MSNLIVLLLQAAAVEEANGLLRQDYRAVAAEQQILFFGKRKEQSRIDERPGHWGRVTVHPPNQY